MRSGRKRVPARTGTGMSTSTDSEEAFLARYEPSRFPRPSVAVDVALLSAGPDGLHTVVVRRSAHPFKGRWSLPGGFVGMTESLDDAAARVLARGTGLRGVYLEQLYTFGAPRRDPRTRVISVAYYALVDRARFAALATDDGARIARLEVPWEGETGGPVELHDGDGHALSIAFDHEDILGMAVKR